jgi:hypothetical protein
MLHSHHQHYYNLQWLSLQHYPTKTPHKSSFGPTHGLDRVTSNLLHIAETIVDLVYAKIAQGYIRALFHCHEAMLNTTPEPPIMAECLHDSSDQHICTGNECIQDIHYIYTYRKYYKSPGLSNLKHWNERCWQDISSCTMTAG